MSKRTQDMVKLRKKLELSSRKTRRSTDLRRSLGRKSVGDNPVTASFEQASFSNLTLNESCHLNSDSAVIDPTIAENPHWFKVLPSDLLASEESIRAAYQKERDAEVSMESNVSRLNISIDQRKIHEIYDCSVLVSRESINRHLNRNTINVDESIGDPAVENLSTELPKRRFNTLRRGVKKRSGKAFDSELRKALEDSEEEGEPPLKENCKSSLKEAQENLTAAGHRKTSSIDSPLEDESDLPKRKPNSLRWGPRQRSEKSLEKELRKVLEDSELCDESNEPLSKTAKISSKEIDENKSPTTKSQPSNPVSIHGNDSSFEVLKRKPNTLRRRVRVKSRKSLENALMLALERSEFSDESIQSLKRNTENNTKEMPVDNIATTQSQAAKEVSFKGNDSSIEIPKRKLNTLGKEVRPKSRKSLDVALRKALEDSDHSGVTMNTSEGNPQNTSKEMPANVPNQLSNPLSYHGNDSSLEIPKRRANTLRGRIRERSRKSFEDALKIALEDSGQNDETIITTTHQATCSQPSNPLSYHGNDSSLEIPKRRANALRGRVRERSRKSFENALKFASEDSGQNDETITTTHQTMRSHTSEPSDKENVPAIKITEVVEDSVDDTGSTSPSLPLGSEACNMNFSGAVASNKKSLSLGKNKISKICNFSVVAEVSEPEPSQEKASKLQGDLNLKFAESEKTENCIQSHEDSVTDTTRHIPFHTADSELIQPAPTPLDLSKRSKNASLLSVKSGQTSPQLNISSPKVLERQCLQESVLSEIMPVNDDLPSEANMHPHKSDGVLSNQSSTAVNASPLSNGEFLNPRRISSSFQESRKTVENSNVYDEESCSSSASTLSLPSKENGSDSVFLKPSSNLEKKSDVETSTNTIKVIDSIGSDSVFRRTSPNKGKQSHPETSTNSSQIVESDGSDSVFIRTSADLRKKKSLDNQVKHVPINKSTTLGDKNDRTNISLPNRTFDSWGKSTPPQPQQEDSGSSSFDSDVSEEGYVNDLETSDQSEKQSVVRAHTDLADLQAHRAVSSAAIPQISEGHNYSNSGFNQSVAGQENVALVKPNHGKLVVSKKALIGTKPKKLTQQELDKMRLGLKNWMDEIKREVHTTIVGSQPMSVPKTPPVQNPKKTASKAAAKKKEPDPYFGDYRPPKRVKPRPYVTDKMYKFLENRLKDQFGLEARIKAEEFVTLMCNLVQNTIKAKNAKKYHPMVFRLRNEMVKLGLIKTQFDYHLFIEDYLPDAFRVKSIPCYGSSKGPTLDVDDLHCDLSLK